MRNCILAGFCAISLPVTAYGFYVYRNHNAKVYSQRVAEAVETFRTSHYRYPATLNEAGIDAGEARRRFGLYYFNADGTPSLTYDATFSFGNFWIYDFSVKRWRYVVP